MPFWKKSLMAQLVIYFLLLSLVTVTLGVSIAYFQAQQALEASIFDRLTAAATLKEQEFNRWTADQQQVVTSIVQLPEVEGQAELLLKQETAGIELETQVHTAVFSPDGRWLVTSGIDHTTRLLEAVTGQEQIRLELETSSSADFTPDSQKLVTIGDDNIVRLWDPLTGQSLGRIPHDSKISTWAFSPDSQLLATGSIGGVIRIWELATGRLALQLEDDLEYINSLDFSPDSRWLASASDDYTGRVWAVDGGEEITLVEHEGWVLAVAFSPDGKWVVTGSQDRTAKVWEAATGREISEVSHDDWVTSVVFSPDGRWIATSSDDRTVTIWNAATGEAIADMLHGWPVANVIFSPDGQLIATRGEYGVARLWQAESGEPLASLNLLDRIPENWVYDTAFSPDGQQLVTASRDGTARIWEVASGAELRRVTHDSQNYAALSKSLLALVTSQSDLQEISLLTPEGSVVVSTGKANEGQIVTGMNYVTNGLLGPYQQNLYPDSVTGRPTITIAAPVVDAEGKTVGLLAAHLNLERMDAIMTERSGLGLSGRTYLVNQTGQLASSLRYGTPEFPEMVNSEGITAALQGANSAGLYTNYEGTPVVAVYRWLGQQEMVLLAEMDQREAYAPARRLAATTFASMIVLAGLMAIAVYLLARQIAQPILAITSGAAAVESETYQSGSLEQVTRREDELGILARVFEHMAQEVYMREERLKKQVVELRIEIDQAKKAQEVAEITGTDYFRELQQKAKALREQAGDSGD